ncbi:OprD family outer membrane porin [Pseudomonas sp. MM213]|uniref:OprD family outer membrane porin n=1 Tax=Pseudomonas sp. MM213 TaxID=2866807 RepID=UPI0022A79EC2|nr:OprD family outer membrane porin [Pseudomonas sp. MM213]
MNGSKPASERNGYREEWAQGALNFTSGFTQGTIGFGTDAFAYGGVKLDTGRGRVNNGLLPINNNRTTEANVPDSYGEIGSAVKMRISSTVLKYDEQRPTAPDSPPVTTACCRKHLPASNCPATRSMTYPSKPATSLPSTTAI